MALAAFCVCDELLVKLAGLCVTLLSGYLVARRPGIATVDNIIISAGQ